MDEHTEKPDSEKPDDEGGRLFVTRLEGRWYVIPATIAGIRESLPEDQRGDFTKAIENTPARDMLATMVRWSRSTTDMQEAVERVHDWVQEIHEEAEARMVMGEDRDDVLRTVESRLRAGPPRPESGSAARP
jgi:hypothetical protein